MKNSLSKLESPGSETTFQSRSSTARTLDQGFVKLTLIAALGVAAILLWIAVEIGLEAMPAIQQYAAGFLIATRWNPVKDIYGALPQIYGTLVSSLIGLLLAVLAGIGVALLLSEDFLPRPLQSLLALLVELLAAIPSVVYGLWGIFVLVPLLKPLGTWLHTYLGWLPIFSTPPSGPGMLPAGVILAIMILPTIAAVSRHALRAVPDEWRMAALALGATRWETILNLVLPVAGSSILGAVLLALGRAMSETMAVTMVIGSANRLNFSILATANTIASLIANQFAEASGLHIAALMYTALILFGLTLAINGLAELLVGRRQ